MFGGKNGIYTLSQHTSEVKGYVNEDLWYEAHIQVYTHTHMDFSEAVFSDMSRNLNHKNASCYVNTANSSFFFFFFSMSTHCSFQAVSRLMAPFPTLATSSVLIFASSLSQQPRPSPSWSLDSSSFVEPWPAFLSWAASDTKPFPHVVLWGIRGGGHPALLLCSCPMNPSSRVDR